MSPSWAALLSREAQWVAFIPVGNGQVECDVGQHHVEDPVALLSLLRC